MLNERCRVSKYLLESICIMAIDAAESKCTVESCFPESELCTFSKKHLEFVYSCGHFGQTSEELVLIFTDVEGNIEFFVCFTVPFAKRIICIRSFTPCLEFLHTMTRTVYSHELYTPANCGSLSSLVSALQAVNLPNESRVLLLSIMDEPVEVFVPRGLTRSLCPRYILHYYSSLSLQNWIFIFESMLLEKSVLFYSSNPEKVTSCILASLSVLFPLTWLHMLCPLLSASTLDYVGCPSPYVAGMHSCLLERAKPLVSRNTCIVDIDADKIYVFGETQPTLPAILRHWLLSHCNSSLSTVVKTVSVAPTAASRTAAALVQPFVEMLAILLGGYRDAMRCESQQEKAILGMPGSSPMPTVLDVAGTSTQRGKRQPGEWYFDQVAFTLSRGRECQPFLTKLLQSQMVVQFFESRLAKLNSGIPLIPSDEFEDTIDRVRPPTRMNLSDFVEKSKQGLDTLANKVRHLKIRGKPKAVPNFPGSFEISNPIMITTTVDAVVSGDLTDVTKPLQLDCQRQSNAIIDSNSSPTKQPPPPTMRKKSSLSADSKAGDRRQAWKPLSPIVDLETGATVEEYHHFVSSLLIEIDDPIRAAPRAPVSVTSPCVTVSQPATKLRMNAWMANNSNLILPEKKPLPSNLEAAILSDDFFDPLKESYHQVLSAPIVRRSTKPIFADFDPHWLSK